MKKILYPMIAIVLFLFIAGCSRWDKIKNEENNAITEEEKNIISGKGVVEFINLEGGFYGIIGIDDGEHYDPINLPPEFQKNGLFVFFRAKARKEMPSIHMWGIIIEIIEIKKL